MQVSEAQPTAEGRIANLEAAIVGAFAQMAQIVATVVAQSEAVSRLGEAHAKLARDFYRSPAAEEIR